MAYVGREERGIHGLESKHAWAQIPTQLYSVVRSAWHGVSLWVSLGSRRSPLVNALFVKLHGRNACPGARKQCKVETVSTVQSVYHDNSYVR